MAGSQPGTVLKHLHLLFRAGAAGGSGEGSLLDRFIERGDEAAFEALVARHGAMVLAVCRRILRDPQDVEDAFQATFLLLVRKAADLRDRGQVGSWLYGVAYRVSVRARGHAWRRRAGGVQASVEPETAPEMRVEHDELRAIVDEELNRLPEKLRAPVVLCFLEGHTHEEAAARLQWPLGTVKTRLAGARQRLKGRLARRGYAPALVARMSDFTPPPGGIAAVPPSLVGSTVRFAVASVLCVMTSNGVSTRVTSLMGSILMEMGIARLKAAAVVGVVMLALGAGGARAFFKGPSGDDAPAAAQPTAREPSRVEVKRSSRLDRWSADAIPASERFKWQPAELVGVLGEHAGKNWGFNASIALSPDGAIVATSEFSPKGVIRLWDSRTLRERALLQSPNARVNAVVFSPDNKMLIAGSADGTIAVWSLSGADPRLAATVEGHDGEVLKLALTGDGKLLASAGKDRTVRLWDVKGTEPKQLATIENFREAVRAIAITPDGTALAATTGRSVFAVTGGDGVMNYADVDLRIFALANGIPKERSAPKVAADMGIDTLAFHPTNQRLAGACTDRFVRIWDLSGPEPKLWESFVTRAEGRGDPFGAESVLFAADGKTLAAGGGKELGLWDLSGAKPMRKSVVPLTDHGVGIKGLALAPDGKTMFVGVSEGSVDVWDLSGPEPKARDHGDRFVGAVSFRITPDGKTLAALGDRGRTVKLWDLTANPPRVRAEIGGEKAGVRISALNVSPDGRRLAVEGYETATKQYSLRVWDIGADVPRELTAVALGQDESASFWSSAFSPDGRSLATGMWVGTVHLWSITKSDPELVFSIQENSNQPGQASSMHVCWVEYSPDGKLLATANWRNVVRLWDLSGDLPKQVARFEGHTEVVRRVTFAPDGKSLASLDDGGFIRVWDVAGGPAKFVLQANPEERARLKAGTTLNGGLDYSPDGRLILASCLDGLVTLWDAKTGEERHRWMLPGAVWDAAFLPDGKHLATGNGNGTVYILRVPDRLLDPAQRR